MNNHHESDEEYDAEESSEERYYRVQKEWYDKLALPEVIYHNPTARSILEVLIRGRDPIKVLSAMIKMNVDLSEKFHEVIRLWPGSLPPNI